MLTDLRANGCNHKGCEILLWRTWLMRCYRDRNEQSSSSLTCEPRITKLHATSIRFKCTRNSKNMGYRRRLRLLIEKCFSIFEKILWMNFIIVFRLITSLFNFFMVKSTLFFLSNLPTVGWLFLEVRLEKLRSAPSDPNYFVSFSYLRKQTIFLYQSW